jgi:hypothetical protein
MSSALDELRELRELAELFKFDLFVFLRELTNLGAVTLRAQVDDIPAVSTGDVSIHFELGEGLKALLLTLRTQNLHSDEVKSRAGGSGAFPDTRDAS